MTLFRSQNHSIFHLAILAGSAALLTLSSAASGNVFWDGSASNGTGVFKGIETVNDDGLPVTSTVTVVNDSTFGQVFKFDKTAPDHRCEARGAKNFTVTNGQTYYVGWRFKLSSTVTDNAVFQWKAYGSPMTQNYPIVLKCVNGALQLHQFQDGDHLLWSKSNFPTNTWNSIVFLIHVSDQATGGYVETWFNGVHSALNTGGTRYNCKTFDGSSIEPKWGVYGADGSHVIDYLWRPRIGSTYADVAPPGTSAKFSISGSAVTDSGHTGSYVPANTVDGDLGTRWASSGDGQWLQYDIGSSKIVTQLRLAFYAGDTRLYNFDVQVASSTSGPWTTVIANRTSGATTALQTFAFPDTAGRYVRFVGHTGDFDNYNNITEAEVWGY